MSRSRAWQKALNARVEIRKLMEIAKAQSDQLEAGRPFSNQENCLRLVMVALIGHFQSYISDLLNELCDTLPDTWDIRSPFFQRRYVLVQAHKRLSRILDERKEQDLTQDDVLEKFRNEILECTKWLDAPISLAASGHREDLRGFLKDNGSKSLNKAISQFRTDTLSFSDWLDSRYPKYRGVFDLLDNAIRIRNDVAHGKIDQRITLRDARTYAYIVYRLMLKADEYLEPSFPQAVSVPLSVAVAQNITAANATDAPVNPAQVINLPATTENAANIDVAEDGAADGTNQ